MKQFVVDAFADKVFTGNPAAVCVMDAWISDDCMIDIAKENNLSETAFTVKEGSVYKLRWFTPGGEIELCGHATLGTTFVILNYYEKNLQKVAFDTISGRLFVERKDDLYEMDFPSYPLKPVEIISAMTQAIGAAPTEAYMGRDLLCVFENEEIVKALSPDMEEVKKLDGLLLQVTAMSKGGDFDCISRSFAPKLGIYEDPVCGSGHCHIIPYWANKTGKTQFVAYQASKRGGILYCKMEGNRVKIGGKVTLYSIAELFV